MSDPAFEAADRALTAMTIQDGPYGPSGDPATTAEMAANEALAPIRELHVKWSAGGRLFAHPQLTAVLEELSKLIYPS
jgi:hypothetical protein